MTRRDFLTYLGLGSATLLIDPQSILAQSPAVEIFKDYPRLYFTGMKRAQASATWAGQFLWTVDYVTVGNDVRRAFWQSMMKVSREDLDGITFHKNRRAVDQAEYIEFLRERLQQGTLRVAKAMDSIVADASRGLVQTGQYHQIPNPKFNPDWPATTGYEDEYEHWNPQTINGHPIMNNIQKMKFGVFDESDTDAWDTERTLQLLFAQLGAHRA